jgi:hypothetical protein
MSTVGNAAVAVAIACSNESCTYGMHRNSQLVFFFALALVGRVNVHGHGSACCTV